VWGLGVGGGLRAHLPRERGEQKVVGHGNMAQGGGIVLWNRGGGIV
jgi:hypothetical protein